MLKRLVDILGIEPERIRLDWVSSAEGARFANIITEFTETIRSLGPSQIKIAA